MQELAAEVAEGKATADGRKRLGEMLALA